jgi:hypothetical protein
MANCNLKFNVTVKGKMEDVLAKVKAAASAHQVKFQGDTKKGTFVNDASGSYTVNGQVISIIVTDKAWYATDSMVQDAVKKFFQGL